MGWTSDDIPDLAGRRAIVTGANSGIGYHAALQLARHGASVVLACRSPERGETALKRVRAAAPGCDAALAGLDLADLASVRAFAADQTAPLDLLVNNAGVMALPHRTTADGFEMQFGTNHLGHFALTGLLLPALLKADAPRVITVSSGAAWLGRMRFTDLQSERRYRKWVAYAQSKLANLLFTRELARRVPQVVSAAAHPGYASTNLQQTGPKMAGSALQDRVAGLGNALIAQPAAAGALPTLYAATSPDVTTGACYGPRVLQYRGTPSRAPLPPAAKNPADAARLWEISADLTGVSYP
ncbi:oxidoreductase [Actinomadura flavalba]|uniref:oxidoreductase n=1 Tax=Actinomadura flavalba TaxID=1120938 RepID=UPI00037AADCC|nr:oxidoreductase [Actinomadura flavalba]